MRRILLLSSLLFAVSMAAQSPSVSQNSVPTGDMNQWSFKGTLIGITANAGSSIMKCTIKEDATIDKCTIAEGHTLEEAIQLMMDSQRREEDELRKENKDLEKKLCIAVNMLKSERRDMAKVRATLHSIIESAPKVDSLHVDGGAGKRMNWTSSGTIKLAPNWNSLPAQSTTVGPAKQMAHKKGQHE